MKAARAALLVLDVLLALLALAALPVLELYAALSDDTAALDAQTRADMAAPAWWPLAAAIVLVAAIAASALYPWGFA